MKKEKPKNYIMQFVFYTYALFGILILSLGGIASLFFQKTPLVMEWITVITAWTSTYVFLLMFKKLFPNSTIKAFYQKAFRERLNIRLLMIVTVIQIVIFASIVLFVSIQRVITVASLLDFSYTTIISALFLTLIQGATGEETGWRGYLLPAVEEKIGIVKGSLIVSILWAFWHAPGWFLDTEYSGIVLLQYIIAFVICITSLGFIIGICYHRCKNLFVPICIHFTFNLLGAFFKGSLIDLVSWYAALYFVAALGFYIWMKNSDFFSNEGNKLRRIRD